MSQTFKPNTTLDPLLLQLIQTSGSLPSLLLNLFSFLHRRTDFYVEVPEEEWKEGKASMGFRKGDAEKMLLECMGRFQMKSSSPSSPPSSSPSSSPSPSGGSRSANAKTTVTKTQTQTKKYKEITKPIIQNQATTTLKETKPSPPSPSAQKPSEPSTLSPPQTLTLTSLIKMNKEGTKQLPLSNGGICPLHNYTFTQSLADLTIYIPVPVGTKGKDVKCDITSTSFKFSVNVKTGAGVGASNAVGFAGDYPYKINASESLWTLESSSTTGYHLVIILDKILRTWWSTALAGAGHGPEVDLTLVDSTMKVDEYDEGTQGAIRKIMFDQHAKRVGGLSSDEILGGAGTRGMEDLRIPGSPRDYDGDGDGEE